MHDTLQCLFVSLYFSLCGQILYNQFWKGHFCLVRTSCLVIAMLKGCLRVKTWFRDKVRIRSRLWFGVRRLLLVGKVKVSVSGTIVPVMWHKDVSVMDVLLLLGIVSDVHTDLVGTSSPSVGPKILVLMCQNMISHVPVSIWFWQSTINGNEFRVVPRIAVKTCVWVCVCVCILFACYAGNDSWPNN